MKIRWAIALVSVFLILASITPVKATETFDFMGGGSYYSEANYDAKGYFGWVEGRYRPLGFTENATRYGLGLFGRVEYPLGSSGPSEYHSFSAATGFNGTVKRHGWMGDFDLGFGRLFQSKVDQALYHSNQTEYFAIASAYASTDKRRQMGYKFLPKVALSISAKFPFRSRSEREYRGQALPPRNYDNQRFEVTLLQEVVDHWEKRVRITPGIEGTYGREGDPQKDFARLGPTLSFHWNQRNILRFSALYQAQIGGSKDRWYAKVFYWRNLE